MLTTTNQQAHCVSLQTRDFDVLASAFSNWDNRFRQLGRGPFEGSLLLLHLGPVQVLKVRLNRMLHTEGMLPASYYLCTPVRPCNEQSRWQGRVLKAGQVRLSAPGFSMDHVTAPEYENLSLLVDGGLVQECAGVLGYPLPRERLPGLKVYSARPEVAHELCAHMDGLLNSATPEYSPWTGAESVRLVGEECARRILELLTLPAVEQPGTRPINPVRLVRRAEEFLDAAPGRHVTIVDLCRELDVSERTLHYSFREVRGMSPMAYLKSRRLNAVRHDLKMTPNASVHEIAQRWGFWHSGEFAADYRRLFGELPSQTANSLSRAG